MSRSFFEQVVEALVGFLPQDRRGFSSRVTGRNPGAAVEAGDRLAAYIAAFEPLRDVVS